MDSTKMLQKLIDGQKTIRDDIKEVKDNLKGTEERLTKRIDTLGLQIANVEDDLPAIAAL